LREYVVKKLIEWDIWQWRQRNSLTSNNYQTKKDPIPTGRNGILLMLLAGTFSLSDGLITERGIAHRCGSVITSLLLPASPRTAKNHYSNCLFYAGIKCEACINRCPAGAISDKGHDKNKCRQYLGSIGYSRESYKDGYDNEKSVAGCGLCQTKVPCEFINPTKKLK